MRVNDTTFEELLQAVEGLKIELRQNTRPPEQVIYDDVDLRELLKVSKRTTATWRAQRLIEHYTIGGKIYYKLSDVLALLDAHKVPAIKSSLRIKP